MKYDVCDSDYEQFCNYVLKSSKHFNIIGLAHPAIVVGVLCCIMALAVMILDETNRQEQIDTRRYTKLNALNKFYIFCFKCNNTPSNKKSRTSSSSRRPQHVETNRQEQDDTRRYKN